jgi:hypothetical protein
MFAAIVISLFFKLPLLSINEGFGSNKTGLEFTEVAEAAAIVSMFGLLKEVLLFSNP